MKKICQFRIEDELQDGFKQYCINKDTTMSNVLIDYITTLVNKEEKDTRKRIVALLKTVDEEDSPAEKKSSVKYQYCDCGVNLFALAPQDRLLHVQNCKNEQKE